MQATNAAIESANQVAKDLAIRSAKAADRKRLSQKNNEQKPLKEQHVSNFSTVADTAKRLKNARRKVLAMTASSAAQRHANCGYTLADTRRRASRAHCG